MGVRGSCGFKKSLLASCWRNRIAAMAHRLHLALRGVATWAVIGTLCAALHAQDAYPLCAALHAQE
jgi:hypothetical protein